VGKGIESIIKNNYKILIKLLHKPPKLILAVVITNFSNELAITIL